MTSENGTVSLLVVKGLLPFHDRPLTKITSNLLMRSEKIKWGKEINSTYVFVKMKCRVQHHKPRSHKIKMSWF